MTLAPLEIIVLTHTHTLVPRRLHTCIRHRRVYTTSFTDHTFSLSLSQTLPRDLKFYTPVADPFFLRVLLARSRWVKIWRTRPENRYRSDIKGSRQTFLHQSSSYPEVKMFLSEFILTGFFVCLLGGLSKSFPLRYFFFFSFNRKHYRRTNLVLKTFRINSSTFLNFHLALTRAQLTRVAELCLFACFIFAIFFSLAIKCSSSGFVQPCFCSLPLKKSPLGLVDIGEILLSIFLTDASGDMEHSKRSPSIKRKHNRQAMILKRIAIVHELFPVNMVFRKGHEKVYLFGQKILVIVKLRKTK